VAYAATQVTDPPGARPAGSTSAGRASTTMMAGGGLAKKRLGARLDSGATTGEGTQNLLCAYLAGAVLIGLLANTLLGWWWLDPAVGLLIAGLAIREGLEAWRGEDCC